MTARLVCAAMVLWASHSAEVRAESTVKVGEITINGLTVLDIDCRMTGGGMLAAARLMGALATRKSALHGCGPAGQATRVAFRLDGKRLLTVSTLASSKPATGKCVERNMNGIRSALTGRCQLTVLSGPKKAARAAAKALSKR